MMLNIYFSNAAAITGRTDSYEMALGHTRSPDPASGQGRNHLTDFTPLLLSEQEPIPEELVPLVRTHRSSSVGNVEVPRSVPTLRRSSDASVSSRDNNTVQSPPHQRTITPPRSLPTRSHDHHTSSTVNSPEAVIATMLSTNHSSSSRSLNASFIDGPPVADSVHISNSNRSSNNSTPTPRGSPTLRNSPLPPRQEPELGVDADSLRQQQEHELLGVDIDNLRQHPWFHGMITRMDAALLVTHHGDSGTGEFLIRQSESRAGDLVLSFNYHGRAKVTKLPSLTY